MKMNNKIVAIGGCLKEIDLAEKLKNEMIEEGHKILLLYEKFSSKETESLILSSDVLLIIDKDGYSDRVAMAQASYALKNNKQVLFLNDYLLLKETKENDGR